MTARELLRQRHALELIMGESCERSTTGLGSCWREGLDPYGADFVNSVCAACLAWWGLGSP